MIKQVWGCEHCSFRYLAPIRLKYAPIHHCPPKSRTTRPAKFLEGQPPDGTKLPKVRARNIGGLMNKDLADALVADEPKKSGGRVLRRRST